MTEGSAASVPGAAENSFVLRRLLKPWLSSWRLLERKLYLGRDFGVHVPSGRRIYTPWYHSDSEFDAIMAEVHSGGDTIVSRDRCYVLYSICKWTLDNGGPVAEAGVYNGGTAQLLAATLDRNKSISNLHLFDSFKGMPSTSAPTRDHHKPGDFNETSVEAVQDRLRAYANLTVYHEGFMPGTFDQVSDINDWAFVHLDVDIYPSMLACCEFFWPRLRPGGAMVFDDYGFFVYRFAAKAAIDEYFSRQSRQPLPLPTGQAMIIKPTD